MQFDLLGIKFMLAMPVNRDLDWRTTRSLIETTIECQKRGIEFDVQFCVGSSIVEVARTKVADVFLKSDCDKLFMLDSDQVWAADDAIKLMALSTAMPVICAAYPAKKEPITYMLKFDDPEVELDEYGCIEIEGCGLGFTIVDRHIIEQLSMQALMAVFPGSAEPIPHIFRCDMVNGTFRGEDMAFFDDIRDLGYEVKLDPSINIGHVGSKEYRGSLMTNMVKL